MKFPAYVEPIVLMASVLSTFFIVTSPVPKSQSFPTWHSFVAAPWDKDAPAVALEVALEDAVLCALSCWGSTTVTYLVSVTVLGEDACSGATVAPTTTPTITPSKAPTSKDPPAIMAVLIPVSLPSMQEWKHCSSRGTSAKG